MKRVIILFAIILFSACSHGDKNYKFNNDLENIDGWFERKDIVTGNAHSGNFYTVITPEAHFGITFRKRLLDFNHGKEVRTIHAGAWIKFSEIDSKGSFVISVDDPSNMTPIIFNAVKLQDQMSEPGQWQNVVTKINIPAGTDLNKVVSIYTANDGKNNIYVDDISYYFE